MIEKITQPKQRKDVIQGIEILQFDNPKAVILVVQNSGPEAGTIRWALNAAALGYADDGIVGMDFSLLIPQDFRTIHQGLIAGFHQRISPPTVFSTTTDLYFLSRENHLIFGAWRILLANSDSSGHLMLISIIRLRRSLKEFCVVSEERKLMERTPGFDRFLVESDFMTTADMHAGSVLWTGLWGGVEVSAVFDKWEIGSRFHLPIVSLIKVKTGRAIHTSASDINLITSTAFMSSRQFMRSYAARVKSLYESGAQKTSSTQLVSQGALKSAYTRNLIRQNRPYLKILLVNVAFLFLVCMTLNIVIMEQISAQNYDLNQSIGELSTLRMRTNSVVSSIRSKELFLLNSNYTVFANETKARSDLAGIGKQLNEMAGYLMGNASRQVGLFRSILLDPVLPFWQFQVDSFKLYKLSLVNIMIAMATSATHLSQAPLSNITQNNSDFMTLYRNGAVEGMRAFNLSVQVFADQKNDERQVIDRNLQAMLIASLASQVVLSVALTLPLLCLVERWRRLLWSLILQIPKQLLADMLNRIYSRLANLHEAEDLAQYLDSVEKTPQVRSGRYAMSAPMQRLVVMTLLFLVLINLSVFFVYYIGVQKNKDILLHKPKYIHWAGLRRVLPWLSMFYMREAFLPANLSFAHIVRESQTTFSPFVQWSTTLSEFHYVHRCLTYGCPESRLEKLLLSDSQKDLLLGSPCANCTAHARYGVTPFVHELVSSELAAWTAFAARSSSYSLGKAAEKEVSLIGPYLLDAVSRYDLETLALLEDAEALTGVVSAVLIVAAVLAFAGGLVPLIAKVRSR